MANFFKDIIPTKIAESANAPFSDAINSITNRIAGLPDQNEPVIFEHTLKSSVNQMSYPIDLLGNNDEYKEYMSFTINVHDKTSTKELAFKAGKIKKPKNTGSSSSNKKPNLIDRISGEINNRVNSIVDVLQIDNISDFQNTSNAPKNNSRLNTSTETIIYMHMPTGTLGSAYSPQWGEEALGGFANVSNQDDLLPLAKNIAIKSGKGLIQGLTGTKVVDKKLKDRGYASNPKIEALFQGVGLRKFQFDYDMTPRNEAEVHSVIAIIKTMKYWSLPGLADKEFSYVYPASFSIQFHNQDGSQNEALFSVKKCWCTGVEINYTPDAVWASFRNGAPVHIKMSLSFMEDSPITRNDILDSKGAG